MTLCHDITAKCDSMACLVAVVEAFTPYAASPAPQRVPGCWAATAHRLRSYLCTSRERSTASPRCGHDTERPARMSAMSAMVAWCSAKAGSGCTKPETERHTGSPVLAP